MAGIPRLNPDLSITVTAEDGQIVHAIPSSALTQGGIGYLYERLVGLHYERIGYAVEYRSHLGYLDAGVDLIARNESQCRFIQCKFTLQSMSRAKVEALLFAASTFVRRNLTPLANHFDLVVPSEAIAFPSRRSRKNAKPLTNTAREAFLRYNATQHQIRLGIVEVPMEVPESFVVDSNAHAA
jgi:hypothetical protein